MDQSLKPQRCFHKTVEAFRFGSLRLYKASFYMCAQGRVLVQQAINCSVLYVQEPQVLNGNNDLWLPRGFGGDRFVRSRLALLQSLL